eukprot:CAMPEP_0202958826 /NCGR_PEP_ID=MMETSP1396-20130829/3088_1 /ASSEMBLY_ACC=CAM_ASM_000872 /TAXON_ID= /ORGANISM="Pseudokeronopsis sp., Strain Brazil" /LENGTH=107 /DNA_ID=CAMNT_0049677085 /DNA_START=231 /DNA_END=554 /DNA_ORIENTATION=-
MTKEEAEEFIASGVEAREDFKKQLQLFWKNEVGRIVKALSDPLRNDAAGIQDIDWEIHLTTASRHQQNINKQTATVLIQPKSGSAEGREKILFEVEKSDAKMILDKI